MKLFQDLYSSIQSNISRNSFFINGIAYTFGEFGSMVESIRVSIRKLVPEEEKNIGLVTNDDLQTYAAIIACWFEGKAYVPLSPEMPKERNESVIRQAEIKTIIDSSEQLLFDGYNFITSDKLLPQGVLTPPCTVLDREHVYILFTSGTTGVPKGVPITRANLAGFIDAFWKMGFKIDQTDRVLQMFELTFDLSVMSYLVPLLRGACCYTTPKDKIKFLYINDLMEEYKITVALMVPSILQYLRPYFKEINFPDLRYSLFCGEALAEDVTMEWKKCVPNAAIYNVYGPTEDTIFCTYYLLQNNGVIKSHNGVLSIGKTMAGSQTIIIDDKLQMLPPGDAGELCLSGVQLTPGYWNNREKNEEAFFLIEINGKTERFYKTGDLCICDAEGDILYIGRIDFQTKIQGFRVELSEIEFHAKKGVDKINLVALGVTDAIGNTEIGMAIESVEFDTELLLQTLKTQLPAYMIPKQIIFVKEFPLNSNGKTDRKKLTQLFKDHRYE